MQAPHPHPEQQRLVTHRMLVDTDDGDIVEATGLVDQDLSAFGQDRVIGGVLGHAQRGGDAADGEIVDHDGLKRPAHTA